MAKVSFTKLGLKLNQDIINIHFNDQIIEVKQYLPIEDKLDLIANVINASADANNFANPVKTNLFTSLEILYFYTNINFTDKQKEDVAKLYDLVYSSDLMQIVINAIPEIEYSSIIDGVNLVSNSIYAYRSSLLGVMEAAMSDYNDTQMDVNAIAETLGNKENLTLLKDIMSKLG